MELKWYLQRARAMGLGEMLVRLRHRRDQWLWRRRYYARGVGPDGASIDEALAFHGGLGRGLAGEAPSAARDRLIAAAEALLKGNWSTFAIARDDVGSNLDWHLDVKSGKPLLDRAYTFDIRTHGTDVGFDTKYVWELSRHHQTTVLAMGYWLSGDPRYAEAAADHVSAWCAANPFLQGIHWSSGIELGMRLIAFTWVRRLLHDWPEAPRRFESNPSFVEAIYRHQWWLSRRLSSGSSANNHLIYELAGLNIASNAMPWFAESADWSCNSRAALEHEFRQQTFASGLNRELATGYNSYVFEALALCLIEGALCDDPWTPKNWELARDILNRLADLADCCGQPPSQGDGDDAQGLLLDAPGFTQAVDLLQLGTAWFGRADWWPMLDVQPLRSWMWSRIATPPSSVACRPLGPRTSLAADAGLVILRANSNSPDEIYCAFDAGPLGYLSIAAHGHADTLAVELRVGGQPLLVDPGTFSYMAPVPWRNYFRGTSAHNTVELGGVTQSESGGPFLWTRAAAARLTAFRGLDESEPLASAEGGHDGYVKPFGVRHVRRATLDRAIGALSIVDILSGVRTPVPLRLFFHLHPDVRCTLEDAVARLTWEQGARKRHAEIRLPKTLTWQAVAGSEDPILGWYSPSYDVRIATTTLVGKGLLNSAAELQTIIRINAEKPSRRTPA